MIGRRHPGAVGIPVQQIKRKRLFAAHVIIDKIRPDQIIGPQHVERVCHLRPFQITAFFHAFLKRLDLLFVDKDFQLASMGKIHLCGKQGSRSDPCIFLCRQIGKRYRQQRAANAIADSIDLFFAGRGLNLVQSLQDAFLHIMFEAFVGLSLVGIHP